MRTTTALLFGLTSLCNVALAQDAACTSGVQADYIPLVGSEDAAEYCFNKVLDRSDDSTSTSESSTTTATATADSLRFRRRTTGRGKKEDNSGRHSGDDEDKEVKSLLKSLSKGPFSIASTFCSCNFPSGTQTTDVTTTPTAACSGFFNGTVTVTVTANSTAEITGTASLNATTTGDDSSITPIATLTTTTSDDDSSSSTTTTV
ncbi:hypothetical protein SVAN01_00263 [Stagonosporopsis vannaccii]|nr:hypothetical protein SVAN01_00263 [Stagonosporopsis vannaccii]